MTWNYRIGTKLFSYKKEFTGKNEKLATFPDVRLFSIIEVYYKSKKDTDNNKPDSYCERDNLKDIESIKDLKVSLKLIKKALKKKHPIYDLDNWPKKWIKSKKDI